MKANARHDLRHPVGTIFLIGSTADAFAGEFSPDMLIRCCEEMAGELNRFRALVRRHGVPVDDSELARAVAAFTRDPAGTARGLAVQQACQIVLAQLGPGQEGLPIELEVDGHDAVEV